MPPFKQISLVLALAATAPAFAQTTAPAVQQLDEVTVTANADASAGGLKGAYAGGQVAKGGRFGLLGNLDNLDVPFSATSYTQQLIQNQQARSIADVMQNDPGVRIARGFGNYQELYVVRGFAVNSDDVAYNGLYGLLPRQYISTELVERVEVFRGANSFINGAAPGGGGIGGAINLVPKRAPNYALNDVTVGVEDNGQGYVSFDLARRLGESRRLGVRLNGAHRDGETSIDDERRKLDVASIGLDYRGDAFRLSADVGYQDHRLRGGRPSVTVSAGLPIPSAPDASANFGQTWARSNERDTFGTLRGELDLTKDVTAWIAGGVRGSRESNVLANPTLIDDQGTLTSYRFDNERRDDVTTGELGLRAAFATGPVRHRISAVASTFELRSKNAYAFSDFSGFATKLYRHVDAAQPNPDFFVGGVLSDPKLTHQSVLTSYALADTLSFLDDAVLITLGARRQRIEDRGYDYGTGVENASYDQWATTPVAGLVFKPTKQLALYANYAEALVQGPVAGGTAVNTGQVFAPYRSRQKEVGAKFDGGSLGASVAFFTTAQPLGLLSASNVFSISGEQRNRGVELSVFGEPTKGLRVLGGLTLLDARQRSTANDGNCAIGVPSSQANLGLELDVPRATGLTLTARATHTAKQFADDANTQTLPSWTRYDVGARYVTTIVDRTVTFRGRIDNVTGRDYWASAGGYPGFGYLVLGAPRTYSLTASVEF